jgi:hypothetical protein
MVSLNAASAILSNPSWEALIVLFFLATSFFYGISVDRRNIVVLFVSFYLSAFLFIVFPFFGSLVGDGTVVEMFLYKAFLFAVFILLVNALLVKAISSKEEEERASLWKVILSSILASGLLLSFLFHILKADEVIEFSKASQSLFSSNESFFWWLVAPLALFFFLRK